MPNATDLREYFLDIYDQECINSSSAHACIALVEYFEARAHGRIARLSPHYLYKSARKLLNVTGDAGVDLRTVLRAMVRFGIPPDYLWPHKTEDFDEEPDPYLHSFSTEFRSIVYLRLDQRNTTGPVTLDAVKAFLAAGFPVAFGFPISTSISRSADIPYRPTLDEIYGGQAVVAVGYDDERIRTSKGALLVRNSWGANWGEDGYGWLPYGYVEQQLAVDFWTILREDWLEAGDFERPQLRRRARPAVAELPAAATQRPR
jgi:C1A family cysteine protease